MPILDRDKLPPVPEGWHVIEWPWMVDGTIRHTHGIGNGLLSFGPADAPILRRVVAWLETANGLALQAEGDESPLVRWQRATITELNSEIVSLREKIASLPAASSAEGVQRAEVAGDSLPTSIGDHVRACEVHIAEEQSKALPDNALIGTLCNSVRLAREYTQWAKRPIDLATKSKPEHCRAHSDYCMGEAWCNCDCDDCRKAVDAQNQREVAPPATTARGLPTIYAVIRDDGVFCNATDEITRAESTALVNNGTQFGTKRHRFDVVAYPPPVDREKAREAIETILDNYGIAWISCGQLAKRILAAIGIERGGNG